MVVTRSLVRSSMTRRRRWRGPQYSQATSGSDTGSFRTGRKEGGEIPPTDGAPPEARAVGEVLQPPGGDETDRSHPPPGAATTPGRRRRRPRRGPTVGRGGRPARPPGRPA